MKKGGTEHEAWFREDAELIDFFAPRRDDVLLGGKPAYMSDELEQLAPSSVTPEFDAMLQPIKMRCATLEPARELFHRKRNLRAPTSPQPHLM